MSAYSISALEDVGLSYSQQTSGTGLRALQKKGAFALSNLRQRELKDVPITGILITCAKDNWMQDTGRKKSFTGFAKGSKMQKAHWLPNTTRGTNDYAHASVYLACCQVSWTSS